jgi:hypothetical protein
MLNTILPLRLYNATDYPNIDPDAIGAPIPIGYGVLTHLACVEISTTLRKFKALDQAIASLDAVHAGSVDLVPGLDYTTDLALAEFTIVNNPTLIFGHDYYFLIETDDPNYDGMNYVTLARNDSSPLGHDWAINGVSHGWSSGGHALIFWVYGKHSVSDAETLIASNGTPDATADIALHDAIARSAIGQTFSFPSSTYYVTRVVIGVTEVGSMAGYNLRCTIYDDHAPSGFLGPAGTWEPIHLDDLPIPERQELTKDITADVHAPSPMIDQVADIAYDLVTNIMGKSVSIIDAASYADLQANRTEHIALYLDRQTPFQQILGKLEQGQLWKWIPFQDGTYGMVAFTSGTPANTPSLADENFISFKVIQDISGLAQLYMVKYAEDRVAQTFKAITVESDVANFIFGNQQSLEVETYLEADADAATYAGVFKELYEVPQLTIEFEVSGIGIDLVPGRDKVLITRKRPYTTGGGPLFSNTLFRIMSVGKRPASGTTNITAILDTQTYEVLT